MTLAQDPREWPAEWRYRLLERVAIMEDSRVVDAEQKAEADTRRAAAGE